MVRKGRLEALQTQWASLTSLREHGELPLGPLPSSSQSSSDSSLATPPLVDTRIPLWVREEDGVGAGGTLLHAAAAAGQESIVQWLLLEQRADPTIPLPSSSLSSAGKQIAATTKMSSPAISDDEDDSAPRRQSTGVRKAYDLATTRNVRNIFRRAAYAHPDWWNWLDDHDSGGGSGAHVPSVLSPEMEEADQRKKGVRRKGLKERMKEREEAKKAEAAAAPPSAPPPAAPAPLAGKKGGPQKLGGPNTGGAVSSATLDAMSPEMRAKIERERRARAAEARLRTLGGGSK